MSAQQTSSSVHNLCASLSDSLTMDNKTLEELTKPLSSTLSSKDKQQVLDTLVSFPDVFDEGLGHTSVLSHHINTGSSPPFFSILGAYHFTTGMKLTGRYKTCYTKVLSNLVLVPGHPLSSL